jgi:CBS domain-containing protein
MTTVGEIMHRDLVTVDPTFNVTRAAGAMSAGRAGSALVLEHGSLVGIFTERDILRAMSESPKADAARVSSVSEWMTRDPVTIGPEATVGEALDRMLSGGFRHLPVMEGDSLVGMVSMRDLAQSLARP